MDGENNYHIQEEDDDYDTGDSSYDDELEEDEGDEEDIADEMEINSRQETRTSQNEEDRRLDDYEILADKAALLQEDIVEECTNVSEQGNKGRCSKKGRCATKGLKVSEPKYLEFDDLDRPRGKWRLKYGQNLGFCMRKFNINWNWKDVIEGKRKLMWEETMVNFLLYVHQPLYSYIIYMSVSSRVFRSP
ncbi:hypothetical protein RND81_06G007300 [Saponaria officinalis]|uniref:Uncharacterized protein n=1 Tax=Saponaria officinalis TaxID=3572 RepID=A0AAW1K3J4_SAPOF